MRQGGESVGKKGGRDEKGRGPQENKCTCQIQLTPSSPHFLPPPSPSAFLFSTFFCEYDVRACFDGQPCQGDDGKKVVVLVGGKRDEEWGGDKTTLSSLLVCLSEQGTGNPDKLFATNSEKKAIKHVLYQNS